MTIIQTISNLPIKEALPLAIGAINNGSTSAVVIRPLHKHAAPLAVSIGTLQGVVVESSRPLHDGQWRYKNEATRAAWEMQACTDTFAGELAVNLLAAHAAVRKQNRYRMTALEWIRRPANHIPHFHYNDLRISTGPRRLIDVQDAALRQAIMNHDDIPSRLAVTADDVKDFPYVDLGIGDIAIVTGHNEALANRSYAVATVDMPDRSNVSYGRIIACHNEGWTASVR